MCDEKMDIKTEKIPTDCFKFNMEMSCIENEIEFQVQCKYILGRLTSHHLKHHYDLF